MAKNIFIARPHPFIVTAMKPFLEESGYSVDKIESTSQIESMARSASGTVISLALSSSVPESADEIFARVRKTAPRVPVLFASLLDARQANFSLSRIAQNSSLPLHVVHADSPSAEWTKLGVASTFLYLSKSDLESPQRRAVAAQLVRYHFR